MDLKAMILRQALRLENLDGGRKQTPDVFSVSEIGRCRKEIYLRKMGYKPEIQADNDDERARVIMLLNGGKYHQADVTQYIFQAPNVHITNIEQDRYIFRTLESGRSYVIIGHPDGIVHDAKEGKKYVLEIKGLSRYLCRDFKGNPRLFDDDVESLKKVYPSAIPQTIIYMEMFETDGAIILVKNKDNSELYQFRLKRDKERANKILSRYDELYLACANSNMPMCDYVKGDKNCKYCPFPEYCGE